MKKRYGFFFLLAALIVQLSCQTIALEKLYGFVNDEAGVISPEYESIISYELQALMENTSVELAVATVNNLSGLPIEEASLLLAHEVLGEIGKDNGILILLALEEREYRIEVGYGLEPIISASLAGRIGREVMVPYFIEGNYEEGMYAGVLAIEEVINSDSSWETEASEKNQDVTQVVIVIVIVLLIFLLVAYLAYKQEKNLTGGNNDSDFNAAALAALMFGRGGGGSGGFSGGGSFGGFGGGSFGGGGFSGKF